MSAHITIICDRVVSDQAGICPNRVSYRVDTVTAARAAANRDGWLTRTGQRPSDTCPWHAGRRP